MNKKGFVLIETLIVSSVVILSLIALYSTYSIFINKTKKDKYYDNINDLYVTYFLRENINVDEDIVYINADTCINYMYSECTELFQKLNISNVIITNNANAILTDKSHGFNNSLKEYIRYTSIKPNERKIIVEFNKFSQNFYTNLNYYIKEA